MTPPFVPLSGRVLIEPIEPDRTTDSGLILVEDRKPDTMGRVVAVAEPAQDGEIQRLREALRELLGRLDEDEGVAYDELLVPKPVPSSVKVGDTVLFSWVSGQEIILDDARYLIMPETDLLAVVEDA